MNRNIVLIGFMGAGKSVVGRVLADITRFDLYDIDEVVETATGMSVTEIWADEGEDGFRDREYHAVLDATAGEHRVIACGGGTILQPRCQGLLRRSGTIVYLRTPASMLRERVGAGLGRPLLLSDPSAFESLLAARAPQYEAAADIIVDTDGRSPEQVADEILARAS